MKTKYPILSILAAMLLSGCELAINMITIPSRIAFRLEQEKKVETVRKKIEAGDLETSKRCIIGICEAQYRGKRVRLSDDTYRRAAEIVLAAYQNDPDPDLDTLELLMKAHERLCKGVVSSTDVRRGVYQPVSPDEELAHHKAILQLSRSEKLWNYATESESTAVKGSFSAIRYVLFDTTVYLLAEDYAAKVSGDPYQAFVCDLTSYERQAFIVNARKPAHTIWPLCERAEQRWKNKARTQVEEDIESGNVAAAERCLFECEKFRDNAKNSEYLLNRQADGARRLAARLIISAYENTPNLNARQQEALKLSREVSLNSGCGGCR